MEKVNYPRSFRAIGARPHVSREEFERKRNAFFDKRLPNSAGKNGQEQDNGASGQPQTGEESGSVAEGSPEPSQGIQELIEPPTRTYRLSRIQSVPTPLFVFELSRDLRGSELKVLLVIVRQTLGWKANGSRAGQGDRRVASAILSQAALKEQTGLASEAISQAVDSLVKRGVIQTHTSKGKPLPTKEERRRLRGPVCFRLAQEWVETRKDED